MDAYIHSGKDFGKVRGMEMNKHKDIVINKYSDYDEDARLDSTRAHNLEFLTTMRYIQKYLKPGAKILEVGAATGR